MHYREAVRLIPNWDIAHHNVDTVLARQGKLDEAITRFAKLLEMTPDYPEALNNLAWIFATHENPKFRNGTEAVELAKRACSVTILPPKEEGQDFSDIIERGQYSPQNISQILEELNLV